MRERDRARPVSDLGGSHLPQRPRVDLRDRAVELVDHPHLTVADRDSGGAMADGDTVDRPAVPADPQHQVGRGVGHPDSACPGGDPAGLAARLDHRPHDVAVTVDDADAVGRGHEGMRGLSRQGNREDRGDSAGGQQPGKGDDRSAPADPPHRRARCGSFAARRLERRVLFQDRPLELP